MDMDLYPQKVYIVDAVNTIVDRDLDIGNDPDTVTVSVAVSGSRPSDRDVTVQLVEQPDAVPYYNSRELSAEVTQYQHLPAASRSEEHTSELQSLMRISYAVFCLNKTKHFNRTHRNAQT